MPRPSLRDHEATLTAQAIARIRRDVLVGSLGPASKLRVRELAERYDLGVTPVREALATLGRRDWSIRSTIGALRFRCSAAKISLILQRRAVRSRRKRYACRSSTAAMNGRRGYGVRSVRFADHLKKGSRTVDEADDSFDALHLAFHTALIAACGSARMIMLHRHLYQQAFRYRAIVMKEARHTSSFIEEHAASCQDYPESKGAGGDRCASGPPGADL